MSDDLDEYRPSLTDEELSTYLRGRIMMGVGILVALLIAIALSGFFYKEEVNQAAEWAVHHVGVPGMMVLTYVGDVVVTPFTPDLLLVIIAQSHLHEHWVPLVVGMGIVSSMGGNTGWYLGKKLGKTRIPQMLLRNMRDEDRQFVQRYGRWGVAAGALTPLPFSLTCWLAGMLKLELKDLWMLTLLRVPRFMVYYLLIRYSAELTAWIGG